MLNISEILTDAPNVSVTVTIEDLRSFAQEVAEKVVASLGKVTNEDTVWLSPEQTAKRLGVNKATLWRWGKTGYLVGTKFGCKVRYRESDVARVESSEKKGGVA
ncbi:MAG: helix-turn-helix domain-containing protein [Bacteroides sp.]|nr:helix-turn-helix domain-containing protein [Bacteroides sp.]